MDLERSPSLTEFSKTQQKQPLQEAIHDVMPGSMDREILAPSGHALYDHVAAVLSMSDKLPSHMLGMTSDYRRHSAFASTTTNMSLSTDKKIDSSQMKSTSGSSPISSGSSYTSSIAKQHPTATAASGNLSSSTVSMSPVSSLVRQRLKDRVLNKRRSKEGATTGSGSTSFVSPTMGLEEERNIAANINVSQYRDSVLGDSTSLDCVSDLNYGFSPVMIVNNFTSPSNQYFTPDVSTNCHPWIIATESSSHEPIGMEGICLEPKNNSVFFRKTMSEPSLKIRGNLVGLKHKINRNDRRNVNPLAVAVAVVSSAGMSPTSYFATNGTHPYCRGSRSLSEAGDISQGMGMRKCSRPLRTQLTIEGKDSMSRHSEYTLEEDKDTLMDITSDNNAQKVSPAGLNQSNDVVMDEAFLKNSATNPSEDSENMKEFLSSFATNPSAMSEGLLKATQNYLSVVKEYMKQESTKQNALTKSDYQMDITEPLNMVAVDVKECSEVVRGRQTPTQSNQRRCRQVSGLLSRTRSAPIRLTGNLCRGAFGPSTSFEGGNATPGLLSAASVVAMEAATLNSTPPRTTGAVGASLNNKVVTTSLATLTTSTPEDEQRCRVLNQLRRKLLEK